MAVIVFSPELGTFSARDEEGASLDARVQSDGVVQFEAYPPESSKSVYVDMNADDNFALVRFQVANLTDDQRKALFEEFS